MNEQQLIRAHLVNIKQYASAIKKDITLMEICGGHTNVIMKYGIRELLPKNIKLISGPGCPVCVSSQRDIDNMIAIAKAGIPVATYGDMLRVPGSTTNLETIKAETKNVYEIYSTTEVLELKKKHPKIVFFGVGFETTAPMTAYLLENDVTVYSCHKLVPPAMKALLTGDVKIDGFIDPGHVSAIIGADAYKEIKIPQSISGFSAEQILRAISNLLRIINNKQNVVINAYPEIVTDKGNEKAQALLKKQFKIADAEWRGLGIIPDSGLEVRDDSLNAKIRYADIIKKVKTAKPNGCRCGEVLKGLIEPIQCPLYRKKCSPTNPEGACMVSEEGSCAISYRYGK